MPSIQLVLPGEPKTQVEPIAEVYRITVERGDGIACSEMEARTVLSMYSIEALKQQGRKRKTNKA